jgi:heat shock protein HslJ
MAAAGFRVAILGLACAACTSIAVDARTVDKTKWHVIAVDGRPTPATGDYHMEFRNGQIAGRFGCNGWGGAYVLAGETLTTDRVMSTMMACSDPAASFESEGLAILRLPMRVSGASGEKLTLSNSAGSIGLQRSRQ